MKIQTLPISHRIKHLQPIFTIAKNANLFASGGVNGEVKLWDLQFNHLKTIKKHSGSVTCVKFSRDGAFLASAGDDGKIFIFRTESLQQNDDALKTIKHGSDVTHLEWTDEFLISTDFDGKILITKIIDFTEFRKLHDQEDSILGLAVSSDFKLLVSYSESKLVLYSDFNVKKERILERGVILENLNSKISFAPNDKFLAVGLQFNKKRPTVDVFDLDLCSIFSLVGHAAPCEISSFCPFAFKNIRKFYVLAVASQDLSISFWNTLNPNPFILLKNFTDSPVLDMFWDGLTLFLSSYDGTVKSITFEENELGEIAEIEENEDEFDLPFNEKNIEIQRNFERRRERLDFHEKIEFFKLTNFTINGESLEEAMQMEKETYKELTNNERFKSNNQINYKGGVVINKNEPVKIKESKIITEFIKEDEITGDNSKNTSKNVNICNNGNASVNNIKTDITDINNRNNISTDISPNITKINENPISTNSKPKRITPVMVDKPSSAPVMKIKESSTVVLFDVNLPEKLKITKAKPFKSFINDFSIELKEDCSVQVFRSGKAFYLIKGPCGKVCFNSQFLVVYTTYLQIYELSTGCLFMPFISVKLSFLDLLNENLFFLTVYGEFTVLDLNRGKAVTGKLPKTKDLSRIELSKSHFLVAEYSNGELLFYNKRMQSWFSVNPNFNSVTAEGVDFRNDFDDTLTELELTFMHYRMVEDQKNMTAVLKQFVLLVKRMKKLEEFVEFKLEKMFSFIENKKVLELILEEMNNEGFLQKFVFKMSRK